MPDEIGFFTSLRDLSLSNNALISVSLLVGHLHQLVALNLDNNLLSQLPMTLRTLSSLLKLSVRPNP